MDITVSTELAVFLLGTFAAAFVAGLAGFAFGLVAAAFWLFALAPAETAILIVAYAMLVQGYAVWRLRRAIVPARLLPFVLGSAVGIPAGLALLRLLPAEQLKTGVGLLLVLFSVYNLWRPKMPVVRRAGRLGDGAVGVLNGVLGAATGLGGILPAVWCGLRGWTREEQRAVFQPTAVATFVLCLVAFGGVGLVAPGASRLFLAGLPALVAGTGLGWALYGRLNEASFRKVVLVLLLLSGLAPIALQRS